MIYGTAAVGIIILKNTEQAATERGGRGKVLPGTGLGVSIGLLSAPKSMHALP